MILGSTPDEDYRAIDALAQSDLAFLKQSPKHFLLRKELRKESPALQFGSIWHMAVLEPRRFLDTYIVEPTEFLLNGVNTQINKRIKAHRSYLEAWRIEHMDKVIVTESQHESLIGMAKSLGAEVHSNPIIAEFFSRGQPECVAVWENRGRACKGKADIWLPDSAHGRVIVDLKKTQNASPAAFARSVYNYSYDLQSAWYTQGFEADKCFVVAVEEKFPHAIGVYDMELWLEPGKALAEKLLSRLEECEKTNNWPWYTSGAEILLPPTWLPAVQKEEESF